MCYLIRINYKQLDTTNKNTGRIASIGAFLLKSIS
jgi:hypothetical protein